MKQSNAMQYDQGLRRVHVKGFAFGDLRTEIRPPVLLQDGHGGRRAGERDPARHGATSARPSGILVESAATLERYVQIPQRSEVVYYYDPPTSDFST